jgi:hypothetical protein
MFVRFRQSDRRLRLSIVETRRIDGKFRHEYLASLGSIETPPSIAARVAFWRRLHERLAKLSNRLDGEKQGLIMGAVHERIPMAAIEEQRALALDNATADERFHSNWRDVFADRSKGHAGLLASTERAIADDQKAAAQAAARAETTKDYAARLERGVDVPLNLGKPLTYEDTMRILKAEGFTASDLRHCETLAKLRDEGFQGFLEEFHRRRRGLEKSLARAQLRSKLDHDAHDALVHGGLLCARTLGSYRKCVMVRHASCRMDQPGRFEGFSATRPCPVMRVSGAPWSMIGGTSHDPLHDAFRVQKKMIDMRKATATTPKSPPRRAPKRPPNPGAPLKIVGRELFCQDVARGVPVTQAYINAGYRGGDRERWELRNAPEVVARISWLLESRVKFDTRRRHRTEKKIDDLRLRTLRELERIAFCDIRDVIGWDRTPVFNDHGDLTEMKDDISVVPSRYLKADAAAAIKGVFSKSGRVRVEMNDKLAALDKLAKALGLYQDTTPQPPSLVTVNQVSIGGQSAIEAARRVAFLIRSAAALAPTTPQLVEEQPAPGESQAQSDKT